MRISYKFSLLILVAVLSLPMQLLAADAPDTSAYPFSGGDGSSMEAAVIVHAKNEETGDIREIITAKLHFVATRCISRYVSSISSHPGS